MEPGGDQAMSSRVLDSLTGPSDGHGGGAAPGLPAVPRVPRQRRRGMVALGISVVCVAALLGAYLFARSNHQVPVLAAARDIPVGTVITPADLKTVSISAGPGLANIPARQEGQVTGQAAAVELRPGTPLGPGDLTTAVEPRPGQVLVPVTLKAWQVPASGLVPGTPVLLIPTPGAAGQAANSQPTAAALTYNVSATVWQVSPPDQSGNVVVDLLMAQSAGPAAERQSSTGQVGLIEIPRRP
jgi:SAF domain